MKTRRQDALGTRERRTQGVGIAALLPRLRTKYRAAQCTLVAACRRVAKTLFFSAKMRSQRDARVRRALFCVICA